MVGDYSAADGTRFYLFDGTGNTLAMVNGTGGLMGVSGYGAWGETLFSSLPSTPFGWKGQAGQFTDSETGNLYCHRRYYTPKLGRWLSRDPIGFAGGINVYGYCGGDPVNYADPEGTQLVLLGGGGITFFSRGTVMPKPSPVVEQMGRVAQEMSPSEGPIGPAPSLIPRGSTGGGTGPLRPPLPNPLELPKPAEEASRPRRKAEEQEQEDNLKLHLALAMHYELVYLKTAVPYAQNHADLGLDMYAMGETAFAEAILGKMREAKQIHFNVQNMRFVQDAINPNVPASLGSTNWELKKVWNTPSFKSKTQFYDYTRPTPRSKKWGIYPVPHDYILTRP